WPARIGMQRILRRDRRILRRIAHPIITVVIVLGIALVQFAGVERREEVVARRKRVTAIVLDLAYRILLQLGERNGVGPSVLRWVWGGPAQMPDPRRELGRREL